MPFSNPETCAGRRRHDFGSGQFLRDYLTDNSRFSNSELAKNLIVPLMSGGGLLKQAQAVLRRSMSNNFKRSLSALTLHFALQASFSIWQTRKIIKAQV